jgi:hypothetical protein
VLALARLRTHCWRTPFGGSLASDWQHGDAGGAGLTCSGAHASGQRAASGWCRRSAALPAVGTALVAESPAKARGAPTPHLKPHVPAAVSTPIPPHLRARAVQVPQQQPAARLPEPARQAPGGRLHSASAHVSPQPVLPSAPRCHGRQRLEMSLVAGPGQRGLPEELALYVDKHVRYIQSLDTVRDTLMLRRRCPMAAGTPGPVCFVALCVPPAPYPPCTPRMPWRFLRARPCPPVHVHCWLRPGAALTRSRGV